MTNEFIEEIEDKTLTGFYVTNIPRGILKEFKKLCKEDFGNIYWVGISELLKTKKKYEEILTLFNSLQKQIDEMKDLKSKPKIRTFGEINHGG